MSSSDGLELSFEQLVDWSAEAIRTFRIGYDEVLQRIGLGLPKLTLVTDEAQSRRGFAAWREALLEGAVRKGSLYWLPEGGIVLRRARSGRTTYDDGMDLGIDPTSRLWVVQINEPWIAGNYTSGSAIGVDAAGRRFLLRQGLLHPNETGGSTISGAEFVSRSGVVPLPVEVEGPPAERQWFAVCSLDVDVEEIQQATSRFVDRCAVARDSAERDEAPSGSATVESFSARESGGIYNLSEKKSTDARTVLRRHGTVWLALSEALTEAGIRVREGRHPLGHEIDGGAATPMLVEIKTGTSAGEIHGGAGQLHLYPRLIAHLAEYKRVLLLPRVKRHQELVHPHVRCRSGAEGGVGEHMKRMPVSRYTPGVPHCSPRFSPPG